MISTMEKLIKSEDWIAFADLIGDHNPIHRSDEAARVKGLKGKISLGVYIASCFTPLDIKKVDISFRRPVYEDSVISSTDSNEKISLKCNGKEVIGIETKIRNYSRKENDIEITCPKNLFIYETEITEDKINLYNKLTNTNTFFPEMYLFSLCAPALLNYGTLEKISSGMHVRQTMNMQDGYGFGNIKIAIEKKEVENEPRFDNVKLEEYWIQKDKVIATGKSEVITFK
jgi:hypothetical protein